MNYSNCHHDLTSMSAAADQLYDKFPECACLGPCSFSTFHTLYKIDIPPKQPTTLDVPVALCVSSCMCLPNAASARYRLFARFLNFTQTVNKTALCRLPFVYVYISCFWIMWLLVKYYSAYVILRQRFLTSGEASVNEWQEQYMQSSLDKRGKEEGKGVLAALKHFKQLFDPSEVRPVTTSHQCKQVVTQPIVVVS